MGAKPHRHSSHGRAANRDPTHHEGGQGHTAERGQQASGQATDGKQAKGEASNRQATTGDAADRDHAVGPIPHRENGLGMPMAFSQQWVGATGDLAQGQSPNFPGSTPSQPPSAAPGQAFPAQRLPLGTAVLTLFHKVPTSEVPERLALCRGWFQMA
jgi:hypothetical protein